ncbi:MULTISPECIES: hypothetical protein [Sorangium]|uniref:Uncharacterized protein n=1 Tax=Sorangium cellulosum TaxID=56 RepID=A0A4P2QKN5_SORCE|nr:MULTISPECIES: hypothetical protein [Sorangium]AUX30607.1 uncharacterized protein SOCE836_027160 [Sorangium cellulosum]WCQ90000.1 hypothetical protein NQZ70_02699 [Sorangium sp. Soce836]
MIDEARIEREGGSIERAFFLLSLDCVRPHYEKMGLRVTSKEQFQAALRSCTADRDWSVNTREAPYRVTVAALGCLRARDPEFAGALLGWVTSVVGRAGYWLTWMSVVRVQPRAEGLLGLADGAREALWRAFDEAERASEGVPSLDPAELSEFDHRVLHERGYLEDEIDPMDTVQELVQAHTFARFWREAVAPLLSEDEHRALVAAATGFLRGQGRDEEGDVLDSVAWEST